LIRIRRVFISVWDKDPVLDVATALDRHGAEFVSTGGTARFLRERGFRVTEVTDITRFPEMLSGKVKSLHPLIYGALLFDRSRLEEVEQIERQGIKPIDMVIVDLYPFDAEVGKEGFDLDRARELTDIGGPSLLRAAAKNHRFVVSVCRSAQYGVLIKELGEMRGAVSEALSLKFAAETFSRTAAYDATIAGYLNSQCESPEVFPSSFVLPLDSGKALRYGENPHQKASLYRTSERFGIPSAVQIQGAELSYNNYLDLDAGLRLLGEFEEPSCVIIKHMNPAGVGVGEDELRAFEKALAGDPLSAFGGVIAIRGSVGAELAEKIRSSFYEALVAVDYSEEAKKLLAKKKKLRVLRIDPESFSPRSGILDGKLILGGAVLQLSDIPQGGTDEWKVVTSRFPTEEEETALRFNWKVVAHTKSNAIVIGRADMVVGVGSGQSSRVDAVKQAIQKARERGHEPAGCVLASDAFFPFRDNVEEAAKAGIKAVIQPGGSIRDKESIAAAEENSMAMVFTGRRCFRH